jgi:hypothetical protein
MSANSKGEKPTAAPPDRDHLEKLLDQALADSFPASDPVAIDFESPAVGVRARPNTKPDTTGQPINHATAMPSSVEPAICRRAPAPPSDSSPADPWSRNAGRRRTSAG